MQTAAFRSTQGEAWDLEAVRPAAIRESLCTMEVHEELQGDGSDSRDAPLNWPPLPEPGGSSFRPPRGPPLMVEVLSHETA